MQRQVTALTGVVERAYWCGRLGAVCYAITASDFAAWFLGFAIACREARHG